MVTFVHSARRVITIIAFVAMGIAGGSSVAAAAQNDYPGGKTEGTVLSDSGDRGDAKVEGVTVAREPSGTVRSTGLAVTGGDVAGLTLLGLGLIGAGVVLVRRTRRTTPTVA